MLQQTPILRILDDCNREIKPLVKTAIDHISHEDLPFFHSMLCNAQHQNEKEKFQKDLDELILKWSTYSRIRNMSAGKPVIYEDLTESDHNAIGRP